MSGIATQVLSAVEDASDTWRRNRVGIRAGVLDRVKASPADRAALTVGQMLCDPARLARVPLLWVSPEMVDLLTHAAATLPVHPFNPAGLPWSEAFVVLGKPVQSDDVPIAAVTWSPNSEWGPPPPGMEQGSTHVLGALARRGHSLGVVLYTTLAPGVSPMGDESEWKREGLEHDWDHYYRVISALWLLVQQKVAVRRVANADRADARRWGRNHDEPIPAVTIVELRRPLQTTPHDDTPMGEVEWSHRWIVDGHWRNQWHPTLNAHVPTWIAPHVKGPEDKPLVVKTKVHAWVR